MPIRQQPNEVQLRLVVDMIVSSGGNEIHLMREAPLVSDHHWKINTRQISSRKHNEMR
jgi:hypothetical protein